MTRLARLAAASVLFHGACAGAASLIAPGTYLIEGGAEPNRQPDGNSIIIEAPRGLIVFDTGRHREHAQELIDFARTQGRPIAAIVNSHWHLDHVGGNPVLRAQFPDLKVYASDAINAARNGFLADYRARLAADIADGAKKPDAVAAMRAEIALIDAGAALGPTDTITASGPVTIAGRPLQVHLETRAVTAGDVWVFDPRTRVLLAGDLVTLPAPFFESACPSGWQASLTHLDRTPFDWLVPGHGRPMRRQQLTVYRKAFSNLLACAAGSAQPSACIDGWVGDAGTLIDSKDVSYARSLIGYYLENYLRNPSARVRNFCMDSMARTGS